MCRFSSIIGLCIVIGQCSIVISVQDSAIIKKLSNKTNRVPDGHRNMLTDVLKTEIKLDLPLQPKLRFKKSDLSFYAPVATIQQEKVMKLILGGIVNILITTLNQGVPPLRPPFPKDVVRKIKGAISA